MKVGIRKRYNGHMLAAEQDVNVRTSICGPIRAWIDGQAVAVPGAADEDEALEQLKAIVDGAA